MKGELAQMVERSLSMREVPGSIPGFSNFYFFCCVAMIEEGSFRRGKPSLVDLLFVSDVHANRPHYGQQMVAGRLRALLDSSIHHSEIRGKYHPGIRGCAPELVKFNPSPHLVQRVTRTATESRIRTPSVASLRSTASSTTPSRLSGESSPRR